MKARNTFDRKTLRSYAYARCRLPLEISPYSLKKRDSLVGYSFFISPGGLEFSSVGSYKVGSLLRIGIHLPNYWQCKQEYVDYYHIDPPKSFDVFAKVISVDEIRSRSCPQKVFLAQTLNIDNIDEKILVNFLAQNYEDQLKAA